MTYRDIDGNEITGTITKEASRNGVAKIRQSVECSKCGGTGYIPFYAFNGGICFQCQGRGTTRRSVTVYTEDGLVKAQARKEAREAKRAAKFEAEQEARFAQIQQFRDRNEQLYADIAQIERPSAFITDVATKGMENGFLSDRQLETLSAAVLKALDEQEAAKNAADAPSGKATITGTIVSVKFRDSQYGGSYKMVVKLEDGSKVWGTVPSSLVGGFTQYSDLLDAEVTFTATFERSRDDRSFAFYKRPTKATAQLAGRGKAEHDANVAITDEHCTAQLDELNTSLVCI